LNGKQKAALLLMNLDVTTACELLKGVEPDLVQELAVEAAYLDSAGYKNSPESLEFARQFCNRLRQKSGSETKNFIQEMLKSAVGQQKAQQIQGQISQLLAKRDPFMLMRSTNSKILADVLEKEHPQAIAVVLSEMPAKKSSEILSIMHEAVRLSTVRRMVACSSIAADAKGRIAEMVYKKLEALQAAKQTQGVSAQPQDALRRVAVILRNLGRDLRDGMLKSIPDQASVEKITDLMVVWEDIPLISDRPLQETLRTVDARTLARALVKADASVVTKIKSNISERASAALEEEASLMTAPKNEEVIAAREELLKLLRQMNQKGDLTFVET
jgi:flagellar motor switch protein FliG